MEEPTVPWEYHVTYTDDVDGLPDFAGMLSWHACTKAQNAQFTFVWLQCSKDHLEQSPVKSDQAIFKICGYTNTKYELVSYQSLCLDFVHDKTFGEDDDVDDDAYDNLICVMYVLCFEQAYQGPSRIGLFAVQTPGLR